VIEGAGEEFLVGKDYAGDSVFVGAELFQDLGGLNVPDLDGFVVPSTEELVLIHLQAVDPPLVPLVHLALPCLQVEPSNNGITPSSKYVLVGYDHGLDGLFGGHEALGDLVRFQIHDSDHLVPGSRKHHIEGLADGADGDGVGELEDGGAGAIFSVPLADCAVVRSREYGIFLGGSDIVDPVGVADQWSDEGASVDVPGAEQPILIPYEDPCPLKAERTHIPLHRLFLQCFGVVEDVVFGVVDNCLFLELRQDLL